jgi:hypothetical protein
MDIDLKIIEGMTADEEDFILERLMTHNAATFGPTNRRELAVPLHDDDGNLIGGLTGYTGRGWLYVSMLYIPTNCAAAALPPACSTWRRPKPAPAARSAPISTR